MLFDSDVSLHQFDTACSFNVRGYNEEKPQEIVATLRHWRPCRCRTGYNEEKPQEIVATSAPAGNIVSYDWTIERPDGGSDVTMRRSLKRPLQPRTQAMGASGVVVETIVSSVFLLVTIRCNEEVKRTLQLIHGARRGTTLRRCNEKATQENVATPWLLYLRAVGGVAMRGAYL